MTECLAARHPAFLARDAPGCSHRIKRAPACVAIAAVRPSVDAESTTISSSFTRSASQIDSRQRANRSGRSRVATTTEIGGEICGKIRAAAPFRKSSPVIGRSAFPSSGLRRPRPPARPSRVAGTHDPGCWPLAPPNRSAAASDRPARRAAACPAGTDRAVPHRGGDAIARSPRQFDESDASPPHLPRTQAGNRQRSPGCRTPDPHPNAKFRRKRRSGRIRRAERTGSRSHRNPAPRRTFADPRDDPRRNVPIESVPSRAEVGRAQRPIPPPRANADRDQARSAPDSSHHR